MYTAQGQSSFGMVASATSTLSMSISMDKSGVKIFLAQGRSKLEPPTWSYKQELSVVKVIINVHYFHDFLQWFLYTPGHFI